MIWQAIFAAILMSWPWKAEYRAEVLSVPIHTNAWACRATAPACYEDGEIHLDLDYLLEHDYLESTLIHEMNHHLQCETRIWRNPGGWPKFQGIVKDLIPTYENGHQTQSLKAFLAGQPHELHAELPNIVGGVPLPLRDWYPWFEFHAKVK